jgi:hypothetical protein
VHFGQKVPFVIACFQVSAPPRIENPEKMHFLGLDAQITIIESMKIKKVAVTKNLD